MAGESRSNAAQSAHGRARCDGVAQDRTRRKLPAALRAGKHVAARLRVRRPSLARRSVSSPACRRYNRSYSPPSREQLGDACRARGPRRGAAPESRSAPTIVLSRCAIAIVVRPRISIASARWISASISLSTALVASSRTSTAGSAAIARANDSSCRSPTLTDAPRSPSYVSRSRRGAARSPDRRPLARRAPSPRRRRAALDRRMFDATSPANRKMSCCT